MSKRKPQLRINFSEKSEKLELHLNAPAGFYSVAEAVDLLAKVERHEESVEDYRLKLRWCKGFVLTHTERSFGAGGDIVAELVKELWERKGIKSSKTLLYECRRVYRAFDGDMGKYWKWIEQQKALWGRPVRWRDLQEYVLGGRSNPAVIGREAADRRDFTEAERGIEALERIIMRAREGDEEASGVLEGVRQSLAGLLLLPSAKRTTPRSEEYLAYVRSHPCIVCRKPAEAHHAFGRQGVGSKASDFTCIPLCHRHHSEFHFAGRATFERTHRVNLVEVAFNLLHRYATGSWASMVVSRSET